MPKLNERFPKRMLDPTAETRGYIARASGAREAARERRNLRNLARRSANPEIPGNTQAVETLPDDPADVTPGIIYQVLGAEGEADRLATAIRNADGSVEYRDVIQGRGIWPAAYVSSFGALGLGNGQFGSDSIRGITVDSAGNVYVSSDDRIQKFSANGTWLATIATLGSGDGQVTTPWGLGFVPNGKLYVADSGNHRVQYFTGGSFAGKFGSLGSGNGQLNGPRGLTYSPGSAGTDALYVMDAGNHRLTSWSLIGAFFGFEGSLGTGLNQFNTPSDVAQSFSHYYYVDTGNHRVVGVAIAGGRFAIGSLGASNGQFTAPHSVAIDAVGNALVTDSGNNRVQVFTPQGIFQGSFGALGAGNGQFTNPTAIAVTNEYIYVADSANNRVQLWTNPTARETRYPVIVGTNVSTWASGNIVAGGQNTTDVTVVGALTTDQVNVSHTGTRSAPNQVALYAWIISANTVRVVAHNRAGTTENIASGTLTVVVWRAVT